MAHFWRFFTSWIRILILQVDPDSHYRIEAGSCLIFYFLCRHSDWFPMAYYAIIIKLLSKRIFLYFDIMYLKFQSCTLLCFSGLRYFLYKMDKYQLFMIDFCYFVNASGMCQQKSIRVSVSHCISNVRKIWFQSFSRPPSTQKIQCGLR